ncbi:MAG TPA: hypothetical protein RMF84_12090 [Polyangiaceae bacterium LLY-WYZ-14_1]|nr:hypothetical protein [Polyangiaceae bacterium LLY-WYZ-14_1]
MRGAEPGTRARSRRWPPLLGCCLAVLAGAPSVLGCGAKTGLDAPDPPLENPEPVPPDGGPSDDDDPDVDPPPPVPPVCIELPPTAPPFEAEVVVPAILTSVDVFFLLDATGSMVDEIDNVRAGLRERVVPGVRAVIPDAAFGVGLVGEFPVSPHGDPGVRPFELRMPITSSVIEVESALERLPEWANRDEPEAQVEGLYQVATGNGYEGPGRIPPSRGCPRGGTGGGCFRDEALPVVLLVTDAPFHEGPPGVDPVSPYRFTPRPHRYEEALAGLRALGALVLGLGARDTGAQSPMAHLRAIARDTGALDRSGDPLVINIGASGDRVGQGVVDAIELLASEVPLDVDAVIRDVGGDAFDATAFIEDLRVLRADPASGAERIEGPRAIGTVPGTRLTFGLTVDPSGLDLERDEQVRLRARLVVRAFERSVLATVPVEILVGDGPLGC